MIFVILTVGIAAAALVGFLIGAQQAPAGPCACMSAGLPRPTYYGRHDGGIVVGERGDVQVRPVNGRNLGTQPRRTPHPSAADPVVPAQTGDRPPWSITTTSLPVAAEPSPVYGEATVATVLAAEARPARSVSDYPCCVHCGDELDHLIHTKPCDIDGCQLDVTEAGRLKEAMIP